MLKTVSFAKRLLYLLIEYIYKTKNIFIYKYDLWLFNNARYYST